MKTATEFWNKLLSVSCMGSGYAAGKPTYEMANTAHSLGETLVFSKAEVDRINKDEPPATPNSFGKLTKI